MEAKPQIQRTPGDIGRLVHGISERYKNILIGKVNDHCVRLAVILRHGDLWTVPAGVIHRTIARGKTVNLCFETAAAETVFVERNSSYRSESA